MLQAPLLKRSLKHETLFVYSSASLFKCPFWSIHRSINSVSLKLKLPFLYCSISSSVLKKLRLKDALADFPSYEHLSTNVSSHLPWCTKTTSTIFYFPLFLQLSLRLQLLFRIYNKSYSSLSPLPNSGYLTHLKVFYKQTSMLLHENQMISSSSASWSLPLGYIGSKESSYNS